MPIYVVYFSYLHKYYMCVSTFYILYESYIVLYNLPFDVLMDKKITFYIKFVTGCIVDGPPPLK